MMQTYELLQEIVKSIIDFAGMKRDEKVIDACVLDVKRTLDRDHDGAITKEEFMVHARQVSYIRSWKVQRPLKLNICLAGEANS